MHRCQLDSPLGHHVSRPLESQCHPRSAAQPCRRYPPASRRHRAAAPHGYRPRSPGSPPSLVPEADGRPLSDGGTASAVLPPPRHRWREMSGETFYRCACLHFEGAGVSQLGRPGNPQLRPEWPPYFVHCQRPGIGRNAENAGQAVAGLLQIGTFLPGFYIQGGLRLSQGKTARTVQPALDIF